MGEKKAGGNSCLAALCRVFESPNTTRKSIQYKQDEEEEKKRRRWLFRKSKGNNVKNTTPTATVEISRLQHAATVIQTVFRGYLAKRALVGLRGIVKLQALIRGQNVRRQAQTTLKCMHALFRIQARLREQCAPISHDAQATHLGESKYLHDTRKRKSISRDQSSWRNWPPTLQELEVMLQAQKEAAFTQEAFDGEERTDLLNEWISSKQWKINTRASTQRKTLLKTDEINKLKSNVRRSMQLNPRQKLASPHCAQPPATPPSKTKPIMQSRREKSNSTVNTPCLCPTNRSNYVASRCSTSGIVLPSYMAATESAKARVRSQSAPRQRAFMPEK